MKKYILLLCVTSALYAKAQTLTVPPGGPHPVVKGANLRVYSPADLQITYFAVRSAVLDPNRNAYVVTVNVTVHNAGELPSSGITVLKCFYSGAAGTIKPPSARPPAANDPDHNNVYPWTYCEAEPKLPVVKGGMSWGGDLTFEVLTNDVHGKFYMIMLADFYNNTVESNEKNNYSTPILVTPTNH